MNAYLYYICNILSGLWVSLFFRFVDSFQSRSARKSKTILLCVGLLYMLSVYYSYLTIGLWFDSKLTRNEFPADRGPYDEDNLLMKIMYII